MRFQIDKEAIDALWTDALGYLPTAAPKAVTPALLEVFLGLLQEVTPDGFITLASVADGAGDEFLAVRLNPDFGARFARAAEDWLVRHDTDPQCGSRALTIGATQQILRV